MLRRPVGVCACSLQNKESIKHTILSSIFGSYAVFVVVSLQLRLNLFNLLNSDKRMGPSGEIAVWVISFQ